MADLTLPRGERKVLQAEDKDYKRGLLVKLLKNGGYSMAYWFNKPDKPYPVEVLVDGKSIKKDVGFMISVRAIVKKNWFKVFFTLHVEIPLPIVDALYVLFTAQFACIAALIVVYEINGRSLGSF